MAGFGSGAPKSFLTWRHGKKKIPPKKNRGAIFFGVGGPSGVPVSRCPAVPTAVPTCRADGSVACAERKKSMFGFN